MTSPFLVQQVELVCRAEVSGEELRDSIRATLRHKLIDEIIKKFPVKVYERR